MTTTNDSNPGEAFRLNREKLGLSIGDVALATKINPRILKALEEGDREGLPAHSFARGFIRSYSAYLKIEAQPILDAYNLVDGVANPNINTNMDLASIESDKSASTISAEEKKTTDKNDKVSTPNVAPAQNSAPESKREVPMIGDSSVASKVFLIGGLIFIIVIVLGVKSLFDKYENERIVDPAITVSGEVELPEAGSKADATTPPETTTKASAALETTESPSTPTPAQEADKPATPETVKPAEDTVEIKNKEIKPEEKKADAQKTNDQNFGDPKKIEEPKKVEPKVAESKVAESKVVEPKKTATTPAQPQEVILEALDTVEVTITVDGTDSKKIKLKPETVHTIKANATIELNIKDGGMINIIYNGRDRGVPGDLGKPIKVKFP